MVYRNLQQLPYNTNHCVIFFAIKVDFTAGLYASLDNNMYFCMVKKRLYGRKPKYRL